MKENPAAAAAGVAHAATTQGPASKQVVRLKGQGKEQEERRTRLNMLLMMRKLKRQPVEWWKKVGHQCNDFAGGSNYVSCTASP